MNKRFYNFCCVVGRPIFDLLHPAKVEGIENLPAEGGYVLCANHLHARDPLFLALRLKARGRYVHFMAKMELFKWKPLAAVLKGLDAFPVDRGHNDLNAVRTALKVLKDGHVLGLFPQGTRSPDNSRMPMLGGASMIALRAGVPVVPVFIAGPYRLFRRTPVRFGKPMTFEDLGRRMDGETIAQATQRIEDAVWSMRED